jgi:hypothetical protein
MHSLSQRQINMSAHIHDLSTLPLPTLHLGTYRNVRLGGPQSQYGRREEEKNSALARIRSPNPLRVLLVILRRFQFLD